jgi:hypothetical protein
MIPRYIGRVNWAPQELATPDLWRLEEPYAQVTSDGYLIMCPLWHGVNGASIPRLLWVIPGLGHPFEGRNKLWSPPHDMGYDGSAIVMDLTTPAARVMQPESWARLWDRIPQDMRIPPRSLGREWWDDAMLEGMRICGDHPVKQWAVHRAVRIGGGRAWKRLA